MRQDAQHSQRAVLDHQLESAAEQEIADQHAGLVAEHGVGGGQPAPQVAFVDDIVVQQGGGVDELDAGGQADAALARVAAQLARRRGSAPAAAACRRPRRYGRRVAGSAPTGLCMRWTISSLTRSRSSRTSSGQAFRAHPAALSRPVSRLTMTATQTLSGGTAGTASNQSHCTAPAMQSHWCGTLVGDIMAGYGDANDNNRRSPMVNKPENKA